MIAFVLFVITFSFHLWKWKTIQWVTFGVFKIFDIVDAGNKGHVICEDGQVRKSVGRHIIYVYWNGKVKGWTLERLQYIQEIVRRKNICISPYLCANEKVVLCYIFYVMWWSWILLYINWPDYGEGFFTGP